MCIYLYVIHSMFVIIGSSNGLRLSAWQSRIFSLCLGLTTSSNGHSTYKIVPEHIPFVYDVIQKWRLVDTKIVFCIVEYLSRIHLGWSWVVHKYQRINTGPIFRHETDMARLCVNGS